MDRDNTLRVAVRQFEPFERSLEEMWADFCAQTGCELRLDAVPMDLHPLHDATLASDGLKNGDWDIAHMNADWIAEAQASGALCDLTPCLENRPPEGYPAGWSNSLLDYQNFGEAIVGVPFHDGPECLIYRKDLFESETEQAAFRQATGRDLTVPKTWDEFREVARFFTRPEQKLYGTIFAAYPDGHNTVFDFALQTWTHGGDLVEPNGRIVVDSAAARTGMAFYREMLADETAIHPQCREYDSVQSGLAFARGEVAMMVNWFGFASMSEVVEESVVQGKVDIADIPHAQGCRSASLNCYWMYTISTGSMHAEVAYDFICFMLSQANDKRLTLNGGTGCRISTWQDPEVNAAVPYYYRLEALHENARTLPRIANWSQVAGIIDGMVLDIISTDRPIEDITAAAQAQLDAF